MRRSAIHAPRADERDRLAFADGPSARDERPAGPAAPGSRRTALLAALAVVALLVGIVVAGRLGGPAAEVADGTAVDRGPFDTPEAFLAALPLPPSFTRLPPDDAPTAPDAAYGTDGDFEAACAALGDALQAMDPTFPDLVPQDYVGGGVNRCEATAPMAALHGASVRALVLRSTAGAQLHVAAPVTPVPPPP